jgi:hypothetical protein
VFQKELNEFCNATCLIKSDSKGLVPTYGTSIWTEIYGGTGILKFDLIGDRNKKIKKDKKKKKRKKNVVKSKGIQFVPSASFMYSRHFMNVNYIEALLSVDEESLTFSQLLVWRNLSKYVHPSLPQNINLQISSRCRFDMEKSTCISNTLKFMLEHDSNLQGYIELDDFSKFRSLGLVVSNHRAPSVHYTLRASMTKLEYGLRMCKAFGITGLTIYAKTGVEKRGNIPVDPFECWMFGCKYKANHGTWSLGVSYDPNDPNDKYTYGIRLGCPL